jgi:hypothetical protein
MLMTQSAESNLLTLVKPRSTLAITSKISSTIPSDPLDQVNTNLWSNLGKRHGQTLLKPLCPWTPSRTFVAFSKFHLNTSKSPNIKVVQFLEGHNFHVGWHCKFGVENGEKLGQLHILLFTGALQNPNFTWRSCSNHWGKHHMAFVKVVEGTSHYNFPFWRKFRPV